MILFVGPLPPPVHGFSVINAAMLARFQALVPAAVFDRAPPEGRGAFGRLLHGAVLLARYAARLLRAPRGSGLYIGLSGGLGQLKDLPYVLAARLAGRPVLVHHHSFAYLRRAPWYSRLVLALLNGRQGARHLALCGCMADALAQRYRIPRAQVEVLSNAAFLPPPPPLAPRERGAGLSLGFLSNITPDKGIWSFLELGDALAARGLPVQALVAGPVAGDIATRFAAEIARRDWCRHLGPVYGEAKAAFFGEIDVLVFPTVYANEAEPVTLLEAMSAGVPVLANARGCIAEMVPAEAGAVFADDARFVVLAGSALAAWAAEDAATWSRRRAAAREAFAALQAEHARRLDRIVRALAAPEPA